MTATLESASKTTFAHVALADEDRDALLGGLLQMPNPHQDVDAALLHLLRQYARCSASVLSTARDFGRYADSPGLVHVTNLPVDPTLPSTPTDGQPSRDKKTFVSEGVLLALTQLVGEPVGYTTEKSGNLLHDIVPVASGHNTQSNQGSSVFLNFHNDTVYDPSGRYNVSNPDFLVLMCVRTDPTGNAYTHFADARDVCAALSNKDLEILRSPSFRMNAPSTYVRERAGGQQVLSEPVPIISGPEREPEISAGANGVVALNGEAADALARMQEICQSEDVSVKVLLQPGQALLVNNRKGLHARSPFPARHDGTDRWLQRTYVRRDLWSIRSMSTGTHRVYQ